MSTIVRSFLIAAAVLGVASAASAAERNTDNNQYTYSSPSSEFNPSTFFDDPRGRL